MLTLLFLLCTALAFGQQKDVALTNANLFNGAENKIYPNSIVFVKGGKIERIGKNGETIASTYQIIDCQGYYLMPGMMDAHTHLDNLASAKRALETGVTTVRTAGVAAFQDVSLMELAKTGRIPGPDVIPAGVYVSPNLEETVLADTRLGSLITGVKSDEELKLLVNVNIDRHAERPEDTAVIVADRNSNAAVMAKLMDEVRAGGIKEVSLAAAPQGGR